MHPQYHILLNFPVFVMLCMLFLGDVVVGGVSVVGISVCYFFSFLF